MAPEMKKGNTYDYRVDIFSLGVLWAKLLYPSNAKFDYEKLPKLYPWIDKIIAKCLET